MKKIRLDILGVSTSQTQTGSFALVLGEHNGRRRLPIIIGHTEATAIAMALENMQPPRPLTHDVSKEIIDRFGINLKEMIIHNLEEGIFQAKMIFTDGLKEEGIECRPSDGIAFAVRFDAPIYTYEFILNSAGIVIEDIPTDETEEESADKGAERTPGPVKEEENTNPFGRFTLEQLKEQLQRAIQEEAYEKASKIQAEIDKRNAS
jgi:bifunctional DNase/RNase